MLKAKAFEGPVMPGAHLGDNGARGRDIESIGAGAAGWAPGRVAAAGLGAAGSRPVLPHSNLPSTGGGWGHGPSELCAFPALLRSLMAPRMDVRILDCDAAKPSVFPGSSWAALSRDDMPHWAALR